MIGWLTPMVAPLAGFWHFAGHVLAGHAGSAPSAGLMVLAAVALAGMLAAVLAQGGRIAAVLTAGPLTGRATALQRKSWSAAFQRQLNPDAAGRARPRAPSAAPAAA
ncbi:MAG: DUF6412 domain-containing protein [Streptosporangiaceae bacterium]